MSKERITIYQAIAQTTTSRGHLRAKGFKQTGGAGEPKYHRIDADLYFDQVAGRWVCDVYTTQDGKRLKLLTRKSAAMLVAVLNSVI